ncbi:ribosome maturation factor RimP [Clostridiaceae bacterium 35-E11]
MAKKRVIDIVKELVLPIINNSKLELVDIEFVKEGQSWFLRVYIDKDGGVTIDDCQMVSEGLSEKLDEVDPISQNYYLEVSSPGLDRPLKTDKDFEKYTNRLVEVYLYEPIEGKKVMEGLLIERTQANLVIKSEDDNLIDIPREKISKVKLSVII